MEVVKTLLEAGADKEARDVSGLHGKGMRERRATQGGVVKYFCASRLRRA